MKLIVNKKEAKLLEDVALIQDEHRVSITLKQENVSTVNVTLNLPTEKEASYKIKNLVVAYDSNGEIIIGVRNAYGNGLKYIPFKTLEEQLWGTYEDNEREIRKQQAESSIKHLEYTKKIERH